MLSHVDKELKELILEKITTDNEVKDDRSTDRSIGKKKIGRRFVVVYSIFHS
jgi:hypothetical protein